MVAKHEFDWKNFTILDDNDLDDNFFHGKKRLFVSISKVMYLLILDSESSFFHLNIIVLHYIDLHSVDS